MIHLAVQALAGSATRLGIVPAGTGNDVGRELGLPRKDPASATDVIIAGKERSIDLARTGNKYYVTVMAAGFDAIVNERANEMTWPKGQMRYNLATLAELRTFKPIPYTLEVDGEQHRFDAMMVAIGNTSSFGGGMRITEGAKPDDGLLDVIAIAPMSKFHFIRTFPKVFSGTHIDSPLVTRYLGKTVTVAAPGIVAYADGERIAPLPLTIEVVPRALRVLVP
jgi:diacylglycerol kinase (ATP)